jgi:nucleotide-binding universal stress UspA family protein
MMKFKRIAFPTDFSAAASHALDYAISLALEHEASLILVHVVENIDFNSLFTLGLVPFTLEYRAGIEVSFIGRIKIGGFSRL